MAIRKATVANSAHDPVIRWAKVEVGGVTYKLAFSFNSIALAEVHAGVNLLEGLENLLALTAAQFRGLLYAALSMAHPKLTLSDVGNLIGFDSMGQWKDGLAEAYVLSMPDRKADEAENPQMPATEPA